MLIPAQQAQLAAAAAAAAAAAYREVHQRQQVEEEEPAPAHKQGQHLAGPGTQDSASTGQELSWAYQKNCSGLEMKPAIQYTITTYSTVCSTRYPASTVACSIQGHVRLLAECPAYCPPNTLIWSKRTVTGGLADACQTACSHAQHHIHSATRLTMPRYQGKTEYMPAARSR